MVFGKKNNEAESSSHSIPIAREETPLVGKSKQSSEFKTFANIYIAIVGSGVLGLPYAFMKSGWVSGVCTLFCIALLTYYCMMLLVYTRRKLESFNGCSNISSFGDLGFAVCGSIGKFSVDLMIILSQAGFCVSYIIFIANTFSILFNSSTSQAQTFLGLSPKQWYIWGLFPLQLGLNAIPTLTHLAPFSIFAYVVQLVAMAVVLGKDAIIIAENRPPVEAFGGWKVFFYCVGICTYAFEGIAMVLPLESETRNKRRYGLTLGLAMGFISLSFALFGAIGYFAFGFETRDIITTNLGSGFLSTLVQLGLCVNLFFSFPLMMNPVYEVLERMLAQGSYSLWIRWLVVLVVCLVALLVPNFADFLSLVGSSVCIALGFVFPALFHFLVFKDDPGFGKLVLDGAIVVIGLVLGVSGTWTTLAEIFSTEA